MDAQALTIVVLLFVFFVEGDLDGRIMAEFLDDNWLL
jgi:hypothetical protein